MAREKRGEFVAAALTVLRAWHVTEERGDVDVPSRGSFEDWSYRICGPLIWLGCEDPCKSLEKVRGDDPDRERLIKVIAQWRKHVLPDGHTVQEIVDLSLNDTDFRRALCEVAAGKDGFVDSVRLGAWLGKVQDRIVSVGSGQWKIVRGKLRDGYRKWHLEAKK